MDTLKSTSFSIALFIIGAIFILLGLGGGITINSNSLIIQELWAKILSTSIGVLLVMTAIYLEVAQKLPGTRNEQINQHQKKIGTSIFFINNANQVLLLLRDNNKNIPFPNCWDALGGHVEPGETPLECIIREMKEEIDMELEAPTLFKVYELSDRMEYSFWQRANLDIEKIKLGEGQRLKWFTEEEISIMPDEEMAFGFKPIILEFFRQKPYKE